MGSLIVIWDYIKANKNKTFKIGAHDCLTFTNGAWNVMHGKGFADEFIGHYENTGRKGFKKEMYKLKFTSGLDFLDSKLKRLEIFPPLGALVILNQESGCMAPHALGICIGINSVFVGKNDLIFIPTEEVHGAWL